MQLNDILFFGPKGKTSFSWFSLPFLYLFSSRVFRVGLDYHRITWKYFTQNRPHGNIPSQRRKFSYVSVWVVCALEYSLCVCVSFWGKIFCQNPELDSSRMLLWMICWQLQSNGSDRTGSPGFLVVGRSNETALHLIIIVVFVGLWQWYFRAPKLGIMNNNCSFQVRQWLKANA